MSAAVASAPPRLLEAGEAAKVASQPRSSSNSWVDVALSPDVEHDKAARMRRDAIEMMAITEEASGESVSSVAELCASMALSPRDASLQCTSLIALRRLPGNVLQAHTAIAQSDTSLMRTSSHGIGEAEQKILPPPPHMRAQGKDAARAQKKSPAPLESKAAPSICSAVLTAMLSWPEHAEIQEHGCALVSLLATDTREIKNHQSRRGRVGLKRVPNERTNSEQGVIDDEFGRSAGPFVRRVLSSADIDEYANLLLVRDEMMRADAPTVVVGAMKQHMEALPVVYCGLVALMALCKGEGATKAKHQAAAAGAIQLITTMLLKDSLPTILWVMGRFSLQALVRGEPELRKQARNYLPKLGFRSLFMLTNPAFL